MRKIPLISLCIIALVAFAIWAPNVGSYPNYGDPATNCNFCHLVFEGGQGNPDHQIHASIAAGPGCSPCHDPGLTIPPPSAGCVTCHFQAGLVAHHTNAGVAGFPGPTCSAAQCHPGLIPVPEDTPVPGYLSSIFALDPCDGSEELILFPPPFGTVSLDNDGDLLYDESDPDCAPPECTVDAECDDGNVCNGAEFCDAAGTCQPGTPLDCNDGDLCTTDSCDPVAGCVFTPVECPVGQICVDGICQYVGCTSDADCDDGEFCNGAETCDTGTGECLPGTPVDCDDRVTCTVDTCDEVNDQCVNTPDDAACPDDGLFCTGDEICDPAAGCVSTGDPCPEGTVCNEDTDMCDMVAEKVTLCHKGKNTIAVGAAAVPAHLRHGDTLGPCP